jgi:hypothetical protein
MTGLPGSGCSGEIINRRTNSGINPRNQHMAIERTGDQMEQISDRQTTTKQKEEQT